MIYRLTPVEYSTPIHFGRPLHKIAALVLIAGIVALSPGWESRGYGAEKSRAPNIVLIVADDMGYGDLGCYGAKDSQTPNLDRLAREGIRFQQFYASSALCSQTRAALMTGRWPDLAVRPDVSRSESQPYFISQAVPLARLLKRAGYHTALIGKWHLGETSPNTPNECGFDEFHGLRGPMVKDYFAHAKQKGTAKGLWHNDEPIAVEGHMTDLLTGWAVEYVQSRAKSGEPFFLYLPYNAPHSPIQPRPDWLEKVKARVPDAKEHRAQFLALIEHLDDGVGKVLAALEATGAGRNTLVLFTSDNGGNQGLGNNGGLRGAKGQLYEGGIGVPLCAAWPGKIAAGTTTDRTALTMDLYPTLCDVAGVKIEHEIDGRSILPALLGRPQGDDQRILLWYVPDAKKAGKYQGMPVYAVRRGPWKMVQPSAFQPMELYNLEEDPREERPLDHSQPAYAELSDALRDHLVRGRVVPWSDRSVGPSEEK